VAYFSRKLHWLNQAGTCVNNVENSEKTSQGPHRTLASKCNNDRSSYIATASILTFFSSGLDALEWVNDEEIGNPSADIVAGLPPLSLRFFSIGCVGDVSVSTFFGVNVA
jgi:hypothetical protein